MDNSGRGMHAPSLILSLAVCALFAPSVAVSAIVIDDFNSPDSGFVFFSQGLPALWGTGDSSWGCGNPIVRQQLASASSLILGGERDFQIEVPATPMTSAPPYAATGSIGGEEGSLYVATGGAPFATRTTLQYDGIDTLGMTNAHLLGGIDLTENGLNQFFNLRFYGVDPGDGERLAVKAIIDGLDSLGNPISYTFDATDTNGIAHQTSAFDYLLPFDGLGWTGDSEAMRRATGITFIFNDTLKPNVDFRLDSIQAVPEPSAAALLGGGLAALAAAWFRRQRRKASCPR